MNLRAAPWVASEFLSGFPLVKLRLEPFPEEGQFVNFLQLE
jgi:hypothetical protein